MTLIFIGCTHVEKSTPTTTNVATNNDDPSKSPLGQMIKAKATRVEFAENELSNVVSDFVETHPKSDYEDVAAFANKRLKEIGFPFDLISLEAEPQGTETLIKTTAGQRLNIGMFWEPICAEGIAARYPVISFKKDIWTIKYSSGIYEIRAKPIRTGEILKVKDQKKIVEVPVPEEGFEPGGISKNGKAIFARLSLTPKTNGWWRQQMRRDPKEEPPFIVLKIYNDGFEFSENEEDLDQYEDKPVRNTEEDDTYQITYPESPYKFRSTVCT